MQVGFVIITYNISSEIFMLQIGAIRKFCKDEFEINVIDNSSDLEMAEHIRYHSEVLKVNYTKTFAGSINGSDSHSWAANFAYQKLKGVYDYYIFFDHDLIPVKHFSAVEILNGGHAMAGLGQGALKKYFWPGCLFFSGIIIEEDIIDFQPSGEFRLDTGGNLYKVIEKYGEENCIFFNESYHQNPYFISNQYSHYALINNGMFLHCVNASNWKGVDRHNERVNTLINIIKEQTGL